MRFLPVLAALPLLVGAGSPSVVAKIRVGGKPCASVQAYGSLWVTLYSANAVVRIDPETNRVTGRVKVGAAPCGIAAGSGALWIDGYGTGTIEKVDPRRLRVVGRTVVSPQPWDVVHTAGSVWSSGYLLGIVERIEPRTGKILRRIKVGAAPKGLHVAFGSVWVGTSGENAVYRIDPRTNRARKIPTGGSSPAFFAHTTNAVWVTNELDDSVTRIDPATNRVMAEVEVGDNPGDGATDPLGPGLDPEQERQHRLRDRPDDERGGDQACDRPPPVRDHRGIRKRVGAELRRHRRPAIPAVIPGTVRVLLRVLELDCPRAPEGETTRADDLRLVVVSGGQSPATSGSPLATVRRPAAS